MNAAEELVEKDFLYTITAQFEEKINILADIEPHRISVDNEKENFEKNIYKESLFLHELSTLEKAQCPEEDINWIEEFESIYPQKPYVIVHAIFTQKWSEEALSMYPQWGDGTFSRNYIVAEDKKGNLVIYDFLTMFEYDNDIDIQ